MHMPTSNWFMILASCRPFGCMRLHRYKRCVGDFIVIRSQCSFLIHALTVLTSNEPLRVTLLRSGPPPVLLSLSVPNVFSIGEWEPDEYDFLRDVGPTTVEPSILPVSDMASSLLFVELAVGTELNEICVSE